MFACSRSVRRTRRIIQSARGRGRTAVKPLHRNFTVNPLRKPSFLFYTQSVAPRDFAQNRLETTRCIPSNHRRIVISLPCVPENRAGNSCAIITGANQILRAHDHAFRKSSRGGLSRCATCRRTSFFENIARNYLTEAWTGLQ